MARYVSGISGLFVLAGLFHGCGNATTDYSPHSSNKNKSSSDLSLTNLGSDQLGVNAHRPRGGDASFLFGKVKDAGLGWVRIDVAWDDIEITKGSYRWERADEPIREATNRGLRVLANINGTPKWANGNKDTSFPPNKAADFADFCSKAAQRYNGSGGMPKVDTFGIWNEPDGGGLNGKDPNVYVDKLLKPCAGAIHGARSDAKTAGPELASDTNFLKKVLDNAGDSFDIITVHKYSDNPSGVISHMTNVKTVVSGSSKSNGKAIWLTETGWSTKTSKGCWFPTVDDNTQADRSQSLLNLLEQNRWIQRAFFYELRDDDNQGACQWGMLRSNGSEKPWYGALKSYLSGGRNSGGSHGGGTNGGGGSGGSKPGSTSPTPGSGSVPRGSYQNSCKNARIKNGTVFADCLDRGGVLRATSLQNYGSYKDIANDNGRLVWKR